MRFVIVIVFVRLSI